MDKLRYGRIGNLAEELSYLTQEEIKHLFKVLKENYNLDLDKVLDKVE